MKKYRNKKKVLFRIILVEDDGTCIMLRDTKKSRQFLEKWRNV